MSTVVDGCLDCVQIIKHGHADSNESIAVEERKGGKTAPRDTNKAGDGKISHFDSKVVVGSSPSDEYIISWFLD